MRNRSIPNTRLWETIAYYIYNRTKEEDFFLKKINYEKNFLANGNICVISSELKS